MKEVFPESRAARSFPAGGTRWGAGGGRSGGAVASRRRWKPEREPRNSRQNAMHKVREAVGFRRPACLAARLAAGPTAGYGKPYVRWCGRVPGRNPRHPTRSPRWEKAISGWRNRTVFSSRRRDPLQRTATNSPPPMRQRRPPFAPLANGCRPRVLPGKR